MGKVAGRRGRVRRRLGRRDGVGDEDEECMINVYLKSEEGRD